jgi:hypothetical protein
MKKQIQLILMAAMLCLMCSQLFSQDYSRWEMNTDGSISWQIKNSIPHSEHIEMSGKRISCVIRYGVSADSSFNATRSLVWPMLRTIPNNTHASLTRRFALDGFEMVTVNYKPLVNEKVSSISLNGTLIVRSKADNNLELTRQFFPSTSLPGYCEIYTIKNISANPCVVEIPVMNNVYHTDSLKGTEGSYALHVDLINGGSFNLRANDSVSFSIFYSGLKEKEQTIES